MSDKEFLKIFSRESQENIKELLKNVS